MMSKRAIQVVVENTLDYLVRAEIAIYRTGMTSHPNRMIWQASNGKAEFLLGKESANLAAYKHWVSIGAYSALLFDGSLLQTRYDFADRSDEVIGYRLAYVPCPYVVDYAMVQAFALLDVIEYYVSSEPSSMKLHSAIRLDYDVRAGKPGHPAAHLTLNSSECRIACCAPMHFGRFVDFVFRNFYSVHWKMHELFFKEGSNKTFGPRTLTDEESGQPHLDWH